jgi:hypothetical protein
MHKADHELPMPPPIPNAWNASAMAMVARAEVPTRGEMAKVTAQRKESAKSMKRPMKSMKRPIAKSRLLKAARKVGRHHVRKQGESAASSSSTPGAVPQQKHDAVPQGLGDKYAALIARLPREAHPVAGKGGDRELDGAQLPEQGKHPGSGRTQQALDCCRLCWGSYCIRCNCEFWRSWW